MSIRSLLHFDAYITGSDNKSYLKDDTGTFYWAADKTVNSFNGPAKFGGHYLPRSTTLENYTGHFRVGTNGQFEVEFFMCNDAAALSGFNTYVSNIDENYPPYIVGLRGTNGKDGLSVHLCNNAKLAICKWSNYDYKYANTEFPSDYDWHHILIRYNADYSIQLFQDGVQVLNVANFNLDVNLTYGFGSCTLRTNEVIAFDEFVYRDSASTGTPTIPTQAYSVEQGTMNIYNTPRALLDELELDTEDLKNGKVNKYYDEGVYATGGLEPYSWSYTGTLPPGLSFAEVSSCYVLSGTPTTAGSYTFTVKVQSSGYSDIVASEECTVVIESDAPTYPDPVISGTLTATGTTGTSYSSSLTATSGTSPYSWSYTGDIPSGLSFTDNGETYTLSGTPTTAGVYSFTVNLTDAHHQTPVTKSCTVTIEAASEPDTPTATPGTAKTYTIQLKRGTVAAIMASNYIASPGEIVIATDTGEMRSGDGVNTWSNLPSYDGTEIANNLTTSASGKALDASQGRALNGRLETIENIMNIDCGEITE